MSGYFRAGVACETFVIRVVTTPLGGLAKGSRRAPGVYTAKVNVPEVFGMWLAERTSSVPRTKAFYCMTSVNGRYFFVKPGRAYSWDKKGKSWNQVRRVEYLNHRIDRVVVSPCGGCSLHLPKLTPLLAFHKNTPDTVVITLALPKRTKASATSPPCLDAILPSGDSVLLTQPHSTVEDIPFVFKSPKGDVFNAHVKGFACSEDGQAVALAIDDQFWVWRQYPEETLGIGIWTDLTADQRFVINAKSNHPLTQEGKVVHGLNRLRQTFTLHPALAPNIPQNSAVSYQDLCMFNNPDEGVGVCCLTVLLPPCKPFDTLYLFVSVCTFKGLTPVFQRSDVTLPVVEGYGAPCIWWSVDCRFAVIAVSQSLVIVTRYLRIIKILPLTKIFPGDEPVVASVAWNCSGEFFVVTSKQGSIGAVTRSGKSLRHNICHLTPFTSKQVPIMVAADARDRSTFVVYSQKEMRPLKIDVNSIPLNLQILMSLQFPQKSVSSLYKRTVDAIKEHGVSDPIRLVTLLYYTDMFRIWPYYSPLRYLLFTLFNEGAKRALDSGHDLFAFFLIRCILRLTGEEVEVYQTIMDRLSWSNLKRDQILLKIIQDELNKNDFVTQTQPKDQRIMFYEPTEEDRDQMIKLIPPSHCRNVDLVPLVKVVRNILWDPDFNESELKDIQCDLRLLLEFLIHLGLFDRVMMIAKHYSVAMDPAALFVKIAALQANDAAKLYKAMMTCIAAAPEDEIELRAVCVKAIVNILKHRISESMPSAESPQIKRISSLVMIEEEGLSLVAPESPEQLEDFAVILGIGFCAADFAACANFFNGRQNATPDVLRDGVRALFSMVWFLKWRYRAICETARYGHANDATLRLLAFPEFVDRKAAKAQIRDVNPDMFSADIFEHYMNGTGFFEKDPEFPDFAAECSQAIKPRELARISAVVMRSQAEDNVEVPRSGILLASLVSHMIPWLRCGIPRALAGFECDDKVPPELLDFEEFEFPKTPPPKMEVVHNPDDWLPIITQEPEQQEVPEPSDEGSSYSERPVRRPRRRTRRHERKPPKKKVPQPSLRLLTVDPTSAAPQMQMPMYYQPYPMQYPMYEVPVIHAPTEPQASAYGPIWDFNPADFVKPEPEPPRPPTPPQKEEPTRVNTETQSAEEPKRESQVKPLIIFTSRQRPDKEPSFDLDMSSELSELELLEPVKRTIPTPNPFPLDDELHRKVVHLLDEVKAIPDATALPDKPRFTPPPVYEAPTIKIPETTTQQTFTQQTTEFTATTEQTAFAHQGTWVPRPQTRPSQPQQPGVPNWRPAVVSLRDNGLVGVQPISADQLRQGSMPPRVQPLTAEQFRQGDTSRVPTGTLVQPGGSPSRARVQLQEI